MTDRVEIQSADLRDFATAQGWSLLPEYIVSERLYVLSHDKHPKRQLVFPIDHDIADYQETINRTLCKLAEIQQLPLQQIINRVISVADDTIRLRVSESRSMDGSIPLSYASSLVKAAEHMLKAAACSVTQPRVHHPRLTLTDAQRLIGSSRFGHTERGSFIVQVSCPVNAVEGAQQALPLDGADSVPYVRRTMLTLSQGTRQIINAIEADRLDDLVQKARAAEAPIISSNLCEALTRLYDEDLRSPIELSMSWATKIPFPPKTQHKPIRIQRDYFSRIEEVGRELRSVERHQEDTFIGTVEQLEGTMGDDGRRFGEVVLAILLPQEGETIRAHVSLSADKYASAIRAHESDGAYVKLSGKLHPGRQPRALTDIEGFELISSGRERQIT